LSNAVNIGQILGLMINGWACDRYGYRKTIGVSLILITLFLFIPFFSTSLGMLLAGGESLFFSFFTFFGWRV